MRRLLVVEDSASTRALVRAIVEGAASDPDAAGPADWPRDWEVVEASSGFEAMRLLPRATYDLILTDINMGDINGLELIQFIRKSERHKSTPLVIISTQSTERDVERGLALGADAFLGKPFSAERLRQVIAEQLAHARH